MAMHMRIRFMVTTEMVKFEDGPKATFCCSKTTVVVVVLVAVLCLFIGYNICIQYISTVH